MALTKRVEVLFDPEQYGEIEKLARSQGKTVGALVRKAVEQQYLRPTLEQRRVAIQQLLSMESDITWEEARAVIEKGVGRRLEAP